MRAFAHFAAVCCLGTLTFLPVSTGAQAPAKKDAATILAQAREALGGEKRLSGVKNFVATGRTRQVQGDNLVPIEFEISVELPDKYVRKDEIPARESGPTSTGFNGDEMIQLPVPTAPPPGPGRGGAPAPAQPQRGEGAAPPPQRGEGAPAAGRGAADPQRGAANPEPQRGAGGPPAVNARVAMVKQDFVRLTLGMFATSFPSYPLTFTYAGQAEAPQGSADVLDVKGPANFTARLFVNSQTHLPIMVTWTAPAGRGRGGMPPGAGGPPGAAGRAGAPAPPAAPGSPAVPPPSAPPSGGAPAAGAQVPPAGGPGGPGAAGRGGAPGTPSAPVEFRLYYAEYRDVDGMQWPFRLRRATGADTTEETTFDRFRVNTKIDPKKFEVRK
jgi:hypothetical protein